MQNFPKEWSKLDCVDYLQRKIILNAIAYYELNTNELSDKQYDELSKQLVDMQKDIDINETQYGYIMYDFDGTTGFDLYHRLNNKDKEYLMKIALNVVNIKSKKKK